MSSEAKATSTEDLGFSGDAEAAERAMKTRGVQDNEGAAGDLATPRLLPVQQIVFPADRNKSFKTWSKTER